MRGGCQARRRIAGLALAALVHAVLLLAFLKPPQPSISGAPADGGGPAVSATLVRWPSSTSAVAPPESEAERLERLRLSLAGGAPVSPPSAGPKSPVDLAALLQAFDRSSQSPSPDTASAQSTRAGPTGTGAVISDPMGGAAPPLAYLRAAAGNRLWPQVSRCWRPIKTQPSVELLVSLDDHGQLEEPPSIVREPSAKIDSLRLKAEAEAVRAAGACAPYALAADQPRAFRLDFSAQP